MTFGSTKNIRGCPFSPVVPMNIAVSGADTTPLDVRVWIYILKYKKVGNHVSEGSRSQAGLGSSGEVMVTFVKGVKEAATSQLKTPENLSMASEDGVDSKSAHKSLGCWGDIVRGEVGNTVICPSSKENL